MSQSIGAAKVLFRDDFNTSGTISSASWDYNHWSAQNNSSFYGRTQQRQNLPSAADGALRLKLDSFNGSDNSHQTFVGSEAITKQLFSVGDGLAFEAKARFAQGQESDYRRLLYLRGGQHSRRNRLRGVVELNSRIQTNIYHDEPLATAIRNPSLSGTLTDWRTYRMNGCPMPSGGWWMAFWCAP